MRKREIILSLVMAGCIFLWNAKHIAAREAALRGSVKMFVVYAWNRAPLMLVATILFSLAIGVLFCGIMELCKDWRRQSLHGSR